MPRKKKPKRRKRMVKIREIGLGLAPRRKGRRKKSLVCIYELNPLASPGLKARLTDPDL